MDSLLKQALGIASHRGSRYIKGATSVQELHGKVAELGMFLLAEAKKLQELNGEGLRDELNDIQNKIDDMRKTLFQMKGKLTAK